MEWEHGQHMANRDPTYISTLVTGLVSHVSNERGESRMFHHTHSQLDTVTWPGYGLSLLDLLQAELACRLSGNIVCMTTGSGLSAGPTSAFLCVGSATTGEDYRSICW